MSVETRTISKDIKILLYACAAFAGSIFLVIAYVSDCS